MTPISARSFTRSMYRDGRQQPAGLVTRPRKVARRPAGLIEHRCWPSRDYQPAAPPPPANEGSLDSHALSAAATFGLPGFRPLRKRSAGDEPAAGGEVGRVAGIVSPCDDMQLRKAWIAWPKAPPPPPNPPPPEPKDGRRDAQACIACWSLLLLLLPVPPPPEPPPKPPPKPPLPGVTPCCSRQLRKALNPELADGDEAAQAPNTVLVPHPAISSAATAARPVTKASRPARPDDARPVIMPRTAFPLPGSTNDTGTYSSPSMTGG